MDNWKKIRRVAIFLVVLAIINTITSTVLFASNADETTKIVAVAIVAAFLHLCVIVCFYEKVLRTRPTQSYRHRSVAIFCIVIFVLSFPVHALFWIQYTRHTKPITTSPRKRTACQVPTMYWEMPHLWLTGDTHE